MVDHIDFDDKPGDRPRSNYRREYFAIRPDSLDASALELLASLKSLACHAIILSGKQIFVPGTDRRG